MMASLPHVSALALAALSIVLNIAIVGCASRTLHVFQQERYSSPYFLPLWSQHFDTRELSALIGTSVAVFLLNVIFVVAPFVSRLRANLIGLVSGVLSTIASLIALIFTSVLNHRAPAYDTLQTWTCRWRAVTDQGVPRQYDTLCNETRFAFYTTIPSFIIQLVLLTVAVSALKAERTPRGYAWNQAEKDHEMGRVREHSFETRTGSAKSMQDSVQVAASHV